MNASPASRRALKGLLGTLAVALVVLGLFVTTLAVLDGNRLRAPLIRYFASHYGRQLRIDGPLEAQLLSLHPSFIAEHVTIGNPPWSPAGNMAEIDKLTVVIDLLPSLSHRLELRKLEMDGASLHLRRDDVGHANWYWLAPGILPGKGPPIIHSLAVPAAHLHLDDDRRHLVFDGVLSAGERSTDAALRIEGKGRLNGHEATLAIDGDPLTTVSSDKPYHFTFDERSTGSHLTGRGTLPQPFDLRVLDGTLEANGEDLKDLYFLVGLLLPDTGAYRISSKITRQKRVFKLSDLLATTGESDMHLTLESKMDDSGRSHIDMDLNSRRLRLADLGAKAAGRAPPEPSPGEKTPLLPNTPLKLAGIRKSDYEVSFHAQHLDAGKLSFRSVAGKMTIDHGMITVPHLTGTLVSVPTTSSTLASGAPASATPTSGTTTPSVPPNDPSKDQTDGKITASIKFNAQTDTARANLDLRVTNMGLAQFMHKDPLQPPLDGLLQGHLDLDGRGRSLRDLAAKADGTVTMTLPQGTMRASLAELAGLDFRGLGLTLTKNKKETPIRCGVASFKAHDGTLTAQTLLIDTDPVLITGSGTIQLDSEALDLELQGHPKQLRVLRLSAPLSVQGTLRHPLLSIKKGRRKFELVDPGHAKDADCGTLLAQAKTGEMSGEGDSAPAQPASAK
jgi:AsmA family protein